MSPDSHEPGRDGVHRIVCLVLLVDHSLVYRCCLDTPRTGLLTFRVALRESGRRGAYGLHIRCVLSLEMKISYSHSRPRSTVGVLHNTDPPSLQLHSRHIRTRDTGSSLCQAFSADNCASCTCASCSNRSQETPGLRCSLAQHMCGRGSEIPPHARLRSRVPRSSVRHRRVRVGRYRGRGRDVGIVVSGSDDAAHRSVGGHLDQLLEKMLCNECHDMYGLCKRDRHLYGFDNRRTCSDARDKTPDLDRYATSVEPRSRAAYTDLFHCCQLPK